MNRIYRLAVLIAGDVVILSVSLLLALIIRFDGHVPVEYWERAEHVAPWYVLGSILLFALCRLYGSLWQYASIAEGAYVICAAAASSVLLAVLLYAGETPGFPRSVVPVAGMITLILTGSSRLSIRVVWAVRTWVGVPKTQSRTLIVGAGDAGVMLLRELMKHGNRPIGFLDDDPAKHRQRIHGVPVLGGRHDLAAIVQQHRVNDLIIAMPSAPRRVIRELFEEGQKLGCLTIRTVPALHEIASGKVSVSQLRSVDLTDLLGREPVEINLDEVAGYLQGRRVLVTGAGGSIGSELCHQVARFEPAELILVGHGENSIFEAIQGLQARFPDLALSWAIAEVRERAKMMRLFKQRMPEVVFHAAAHKHVHFMEESPDEAVKTNIFGTQNVAEAALACGAERFVLISTDKAVNPSSVMGATKRVAEYIVQSLNGLGRTKFTAVRFGNVLGSRGSVVPVFQQQIARGGPVTVTDPEMTRYFMTIPEAAQLVIQSAALGQGGDVFVLDMGEPIRIVDLARTLIRLSGLEPDKDIQVVFTGRRPGEKAFEEILTAEEGTELTRHERIFAAHTHVPDRALLDLCLTELEELAHRGDVERIVEVLMRLVPTYQSEAARQVVPD